MKTSITPTWPTSPPTGLTSVSAVTLVHCPVTPWFPHRCHPHGAAQAALVVKNPPANARDVRDAASIPGSGRSLGGGHGNPLQYSCLENPMDRGAWKVLDRRVIQSQTQLKWLSTHAISTITVPKSWSAKIMCRLPWPHVCTGSHTTYTQQVRLPRTLAAEGLNIPAS